MKIIQLFHSEDALIKRALKRDVTAERLLFDRLAPKMLSVCRYYISDLHYAEDVMITAFAKIFENLDKYRFEGSFEGWIRRIMVRESIDFLRSRKKMYFVEIEEAENKIVETAELRVDPETLQAMIDKLPDGYKTVLLLFAVDGFSHKEIAEVLGISESTSKSQLYKARRMLQEMMNNPMARLR